MAKVPKSVLDVLEGLVARSEAPELIVNSGSPLDRVRRMVADRPLMTTNTPTDNRIDDRLALLSAMQRDNSVSAVPSARELNKILDPIVDYMGQNYSRLDPVGPNLGRAGIPLVPGVTGAIKGTRLQPIYFGDLQLTEALPRLAVNDPKTFRSVMRQAITNQAALTPQSMSEASRNAIGGSTFFPVTNEMYRALSEVTGVPARFLRRAGAIGSAQAGPQVEGLRGMSPLPFIRFNEKTGKFFFDEAAAAMVFPNLPKDKNAANKYITGIRSIADYYVDQFNDPLNMMGIVKGIANKTTPYEWANTMELSGIPVDSVLSTAMAADLKSALPKSPQGAVISSIPTLVLARALNLEPAAAMENPWFLTRALSAQTGRASTSAKASYEPEYLNRLDDIATGAITTNPNKKFSEQNISEGTREMAKYRKSMGIPEGELLQPDVRAKLAENEASLRKAVESGQSDEFVIKDGVVERKFREELLLPTKARTKRNVGLLRTTRESVNRGAIDPRLAVVLLMSLGVSGAAAQQYLGVE